MRHRLEEYSWQRQEALLNEQLPQFRVTVKASALATPTRVHVVHARSSDLNAIPLLLIPPFPFTNLSLGHLIEPLIAPDDPDNEQSYHVVIPSLPGLGFSDALPLGISVIETTAEILDAAMKQLGYDHYITSNTGATSSSPALVEWNLAKHLALYYSESCVGSHLIQPPLAPPSLSTSPAEWIKWKMFSFFKTPMLGYSEADITSSKRKDIDRPKNPWAFNLESQQAGEPSVISYALCDSPTGMLLFVLMLLKVMGPDQEFTPQEILTFTELMWLPGPENMLRFWADSAKHAKTFAKPKSNDKRGGKRKPMVGLTIFKGNDDDDRGPNDEEAALPRRASHTYSCPAWARTQFDVVNTRHISEEPGLLLWERPQAIIDGVRGMTKRVLAVDSRLKAPQAPNTILLEQVTIEGAETAPGEVSGTTMQGSEDISSGLTSPLSASPLEDGVPLGQEVVKEGLPTFGQDSSGYLRPPVS